MLSVSSCIVSGECGTETVKRWKPSVKRSRGTSDNDNYYSQHSQLHLIVDDCVAGQEDDPPCEDVAGVSQCYQAELCNIVGDRSRR